MRTKAVLGSAQRARFAKDAKVTNARTRAAELTNELYAAVQAVCDCEIVDECDSPALTQLMLVHQRLKETILQEAEASQ